MHWIDPNCLPQPSGTIERFITNGRGEIDGLVLAGARGRPLLVCTPPHLAAAIEAVLHIGDTVSVRGIRPRGADILAAVSLTLSDGAVLLDHGPDEHADRRPVDGCKWSRMAVEGVVRLSLFSPKGELRGALLADSTVLRVGHKEAARLADLLHEGSYLAAAGSGLETKHGRVLDAEEVGPNNRSLSSVKQARPKPKQNRNKDHQPTEKSISATAR